MLSRLALRSNSAVIAPLANTSVRTYAQAPRKPQQPTTAKAQSKATTSKVDSQVLKAGSTKTDTSTAKYASSAQSKAKERVKSTSTATKPAASTPQTTPLKPQSTIVNRTSTSTTKQSTATAGVTQAPKSAASVTSAVSAAASTAKAKPVPQPSNDDVPPPSKAGAQSTATKSASKTSNPVPPTSIPKEPQPAASAGDPLSSETPETTKPLPDLRQGIPSTFAQEFSKASETSSSSSKDHRDPQNITEDGSDNPQASDASGTGSSRARELPRSAYETSGDRLRNRVANWGYLGIALFGVTGGFYLTRNWDTEAEELAHKDAPNGWGAELMYERAKARLNSQLGYYTEPNFPKLLPELDPAIKPPYTLVVSLEDLLVHSEWSREYGWRTAKRPGVDYFIRYLSQYYEIVIFTSLPSQPADQIIRKLDPYRISMWQLYRENTKYENGAYIKDLSYLNRPLDKTILVDTDPVHAKNQPENAVVIPKWKGQPNDKGLVSLIPFLEYLATMKVSDIRTVLKSFEGKSLPEEFARREALARAKHEERVKEEKKKGKRSAPGSLMGALGMKHTPGQQGMMMMDGGLGAADGDKFIGDIIRERGMKNYEMLEKQIREEGEKWLAEEKEFEKKMMEENMKSSKKWMGSWLSAEEKNASAAAAEAAASSPSASS